MTLCHGRVSQCSEKKGSTRRYPLEPEFYIDILVLVVKSGRYIISYYDIGCNNKHHKVKPKLYNLDWSVLGDF